MVGDLRLISRGVQSTGAEYLLATKIHAPQYRPNLLHRPELIKRLSTTPLPRLTLVDAPAGWGKTTLLAEWHATAEPDKQFAWLALDRADNDPVRFWTYVITALQTAKPDVGAKSLEMLRVAGVDPTEVALPALINELNDFTGVIVLVLDDLHLISNKDVHYQLGFLLDHAPLSLRLVIATRADPPLALARLRVAGELREIRARDLRFNADEATALLNELHALGLDRADVQRLWDRTEGWAAGLYLAALSLRGHPDVHRFVAEFAGDDRHIVDYLGSEVLGGQPDDVRSFLLETSILDRLCGPLCDAVTERTGSATLLEEIERSNLFLVPLDNTREWYRYHHLFATLLHHELAHDDPQRVALLHRRASAWHRRNGLIPDAIRHALAAGDISEATELIARYWSDVLNQGRLETVDGWLSELPEDVIQGDPRLCLARAGTSMTVGRRHEVDAWLDAAEAAGADQPGTAAGASVATEAAIYRAVHRYMIGDFSAAVAAARRAVGGFQPDDTSPWRAMAFAALGRALYWHGDSRGAASALQEAARHAQPPRNNLSVIGALGYLAVIHLEAGEDRQAETTAGTAIRMGDDQGLAEHWVTMIAHIASGRARLEHGDLAGAEALLERAVELARRGAGIVETAFSLAALAALRRRQGHGTDAAALLGQVRAAVERTPDPDSLARVLSRVDRHGKPTASPAAETHAPVEELSDRELSVLRLLGGSLTRREIGEALHVSPNTVKTHIQAIYRKLLVSSRGDAVARAREAGLL